MNSVLLSCALWLAITGPLLSLGAAEMPKQGQPAPAFKGTDQDGKAWNLAEHKRKSAVLLYFYPKDDTPGCTRQACGLRDQMAHLKQAGVEVVGVSFDSAESHKSFISKHNLNFRLLSDPKGEIADLYGVRIPNQDRARRVSFLINKEGQVAHVTDSPSPEKHLAEMKAAIEKLNRN